MYVQIVEKPFEKQSFRPLKLALKRKQEENSRALVPWGGGGKDTREIQAYFGSYYLWILMKYKFWKAIL